ncbi:hypothetical protein [Leucobacter sp. M11]|uniref:hypothetical protein n=1 Tax=Leucobacter sp. M11 TaxID=2993565 RepID=UPI002D8040D1|nr:hypothetical protein [Leucobacter sp. M11]MEB4616204.1 hypothetical protein [Leucobacter sp. M11]
MASGARSGQKMAAWLLVLALLAVGVFYVVTKRQELQDRFEAANYEPSARVLQVIDRLALSDSGELIFLASKPTVESSQRFNQQCKDVSHSDDGHVLGCYADGRIHLFEVADERLSGVVEVTAAHELLHASFARLSEAEVSTLMPQLETAYADLSTEDPALKERMDLYAHLGRSAFANELHSVLGTEVASLPAELEQHYKTWFSDRSGVVNLFNRYHGVFVELQEQTEALETEMKQLAESIQQRSDAYTAELEAYDQDLASFKTRNANYEFSNAPWEFDQIRTELGLRRDWLEGERSALNADIDRYNGLREQLAALSETSAELDRTIDSNLAPPASEQ